MIFLNPSKGHTGITKSNRLRRTPKIIQVDYSPPAWIEANALEYSNALLPTTKEHYARSIAPRTTLEELFGVGEAADGGDPMGARSAWEGQGGLEACPQVGLPHMSAASMQ